MAIDTNGTYFFVERGISGTTLETNILSYQSGQTGYDTLVTYDAWDIIIAGISVDRFTNRLYALQDLNFSDREDLPLRELRYYDPASNEMVFVSYMEKANPSHDAEAFTFFDGLHYPGAPLFTGSLPRPLTIRNLRIRPY